MGSGVEGSEEGGRRAALFDEVVGVLEDVFECVDRGAASFSCAEGEGIGRRGSEVGEGLLGLGGCEPGEEVLDWC